MGAVGAESRGVGDEENGVGFMMEGDTAADKEEVGGYTKVQVDVSNLPPTTSMVSTQYVSTTRRCSS